MPGRARGAPRRFTIISIVLSAIAAGCSGKAELTIPGEENPTPEGGADVSVKADGSQVVIQVGDSSARDRGNIQPTPDGCVAVACRSEAGLYCGVIGNGCNGQQDCGPCPAGMVCGANGNPNVCGYAGDACTPLKCAQTSGTYCGSIGDGCGRQLMCPSCTGGFTCGGGGSLGICGPPTNTGLCATTVRA